MTARGEHEVVAERAGEELGDVAVVELDRDLRAAEARVVSGGDDATLGDPVLWPRMPTPIPDSKCVDSDRPAVIEGATVQWASTIWLAAASMRAGFAIHET
jgi:hypothetical protein